MELSLVGLQNAGKTSLVNSIAVSWHIPNTYFGVLVSGSLLTFFLLCLPDRWLQWGHDSNCKYLFLEQIPNKAFDGV
jgi:hypothetical protein